MQKILFTTASCVACYLAIPCFGQRVAGPFIPTTIDTPASFSNKAKQELPADLPQAKLLFIKFSPAAVPLKRPADMPRRQYKMRMHHNKIYAESNEQLEKAAKRYPFSYRITTQDSSTYYAQRGYKYALFHNSFNALPDNTFVGTRSNGMYATKTEVKLFLQDLVTGNKYEVDTFSETFIYYYTGVVGKLLKRVNKQFHPNKQS